MIYVCSDIHGKYDDFMNILKQIEFDDEDYMYVIGDVIDRGPEPIKTLQYIMKQDNMTMLIGNHEHMMLKATFYRDYEQYYIWMRNGGGITLDQFQELSREEQDAIMVYLLRSPLVMPQIKVNDKYFYLAHASHLDKYIDEGIYYIDAKEEELEKVVWNRDYLKTKNTGLEDQYGELYSKYKNTTLIIGHTPVYYTDYGKIKGNLPRISRTKRGHLINIDCGCAAGFPLGCLRLNDMKEFYANNND